MVTMLSFRDAAMFPALDAARRERRTPLMYRVTYKRHVTEITVDGFFVPDDVAARLDGLYRDYVDWWLTTPARRWFPRAGVGVSDFVNQDFVHLVVLREHTDWWVMLFNDAAPLTYNRWDRAIAVWRTSS
ncbi:MAG: hypothetical protein ACREF4_19975 [Gammaproteobacteria bacterium]